jgi:hypothetical protein
MRGVVGGKSIQATFGRTGTVLLAGVAVVLVVGGASPPSPDDVCVRRLKRLTFLMRMYAEDHDNRLPAVRTSADIRRHLETYVGGHSESHPWLPEEEEADRKGPIFVCPVTQRPYQMNPAMSGKEIGWEFAKVKRPGTVVLLHDAKPHSAGRWTVGYLDGHVVREKRLPLRTGSR